MATNNDVLSRYFSNTDGPVFALVNLPETVKGALFARYSRSSKSQKFTLTRFIYKTETGNPVQMAYAFLSHLHQQYPRLDTQLENIQVNDPHLPAFYQMGYVESFRRIEMWRGTPPASLTR